MRKIRKILSVSICMTVLLVSNSCRADKLFAILEKLRTLVSIQNDALGVQRDIFRQQQDISSLMRQVDGHMTGHSGWGTYQFHDYQSYGESARDWSGVLHMTENGQGTGELGQMVGQLSSQFPADRDTFNRGVTDRNSQKYYALKSQTILATRAASQLDYNKIQDQIAYQQMLQQQVEKSNDLKAAVDLNNRIQVEGNLINLEVLRQASLANQQQAITEQANVNTALAHARFLTKN